MYKPLELEEKLNNPLLSFNKEEGKFSILI